MHEFGIGFLNFSISFFSFFSDKKTKKKKQEMVVIMRCTVFAYFINIGTFLITGATKRKQRTKGKNDNHLFFFCHFVILSFAALSLCFILKQKYISKTNKYITSKQINRKHFICFKFFITPVPYSQ